MVGLTTTDMAVSARCAMSTKKAKDEITVEAELQLEYHTDHGGSRVDIIRTFDKAWHRALEVSAISPVTVTFLRFVRKDLDDKR